MSTRRDFLKTSTLATSALLLPDLERIASTEKSQHKSKAAIELKILATDWGFNGSLEDYLKKVKAEGYDGIESWWPNEKQAQNNLFGLLKKYELDVGFLCGASQSNWQEHLAAFKTATLAATQSSFRPLYVNCHSGRDYFSYQENKAFIDHTTELTKESGIPIYHETHRSRMLFAAPIARQYLEKNPALRLTLDISHWCNVSESLLEDQQDTVDLALSRTGHIHSRIGHPQGPQVSDPGAPEWEGALKAHVAWWDKVVEFKKKSGEALTVLTEFGPPNYMPILPYTKQPVADQWAINVYMMKLFRERYA